MKKTLFAGMAALAAVLAAGTGTANAQDAANKIAESKDWEAYTYVEGGQKVCYMLTFPKSMKGGEDSGAYLAVTKVAGQPKTVVLSVGANYGKGSRVHASSMKNGRAVREFSMFTMGKGAWVKTAKDDAALVSAFRRDHTFDIAAVDLYGGDISAKFSLMGFSAVSNAMDGHCGR